MELVARQIYDEEDGSWVILINEIEVFRVGAGDFPDDLDSMQTVLVEAIESFMGVMVIRGI
jgi:hypothetical protein